MNDFLDDLDKELKWLDITSKNEEIKKPEIKINKVIKKSEQELRQKFKNEQKQKRIANLNIKNNNNKPVINKIKINPVNIWEKRLIPEKINENWNNKSWWGNAEVRWKFVSNFPETKFYLPSLREWYTRFIPIWWNNETGSKNMWMVQYDEDILIIDCWVQFTDASLPWVNYSIPDVSFLSKYKKNIKWILITHAHLDHIWALKHVLPALWMPVLYGTKLTLWFIKKQLIEAELLDYTTLVEVDSSSEEKIKIWKFLVEFFAVNHSVPDSAWICIESPGWTRFVHTWDFKIDHTPVIDKPSDLDRLERIWKRWVSLLLSDSTGSWRKGFSMSEKNVWEALEKIVSEHHKGRLIIAAFSSWISRVQQLVDICEKYQKTIFLSWRSMIENVAIAKELGYLNVKPWIIRKMTSKATEWILPHKQIIITTWSQWEQFSALSRMAEWSHRAVEILKWDTVIFSSSVVPGNDKSVVWIINKLIKLWANVVTKDDWEVHTWGHAFQEEQKIMLKLINPKYFMPIYGDLYFRTIHSNTAISTWFDENNIIMMENWHIVDFTPNWTSIFKSRIKAPIQEIIIDSNIMWLANSHVIKAREKMMNSWVLVLNYKVDKKTRAILWLIKLETRWLVYLDQVRYIHRLIIKKAKELYDNTILVVPDIEEKELIKIIKTDLEKYLLQKMDREPMIIPMITTV
jgi:ribonuclease J